MANPQHLDSESPPLPRGSIWRRWYLRPWVILLVSVFLIGGASLIRPVMREQLGRSLASDSSLDFEPAVFPFRERLEFLPFTMWHNLKRALVELPLDRGEIPARLSRLVWFPELEEIRFRDVLENSFPLPGEPKIDPARRYVFNPAQFPHVKVLNCPGVVADSAFFQRLQSCRELTDLHLCSSPLSVESCRWLAKQSGLKNLSLDDCGLSDEMLEELATLTSLETLTLDEPGISDRGVQAISRMPSLRELVISNAQLTGEGLASLASTRLTWLQLGDVPLTDEDFARFSPGLPTLKILCLHNLAITDEALEIVAKCENLERVDIHCPEIRFKAAARLAALPQLQDLRINGSECELPISDPPRVRGSR